MAKFCLGCGAQLSDAAKFCPGCGTQTVPAGATFALQAAPTQPYPQQQPIPQPYPMGMEPPAQKKKAPILLIILLIIALLAGGVVAAVLFSKRGPEPEPIVTTTQPAITARLEITAQTETTKTAEESTAPLSDSERYVLELAQQTLGFLKNKDWGALGAMVHPEQGLTFSPYGYVDTDTAVCLGAGDVKALEYDDEVRVWGSFDGSGEPIELTFAAYYDRFVFDRDFTKAPQVAVDRVIRTNLLDNLYVFGNGGAYVDFHVPGSELYEGMDWASLRLMFAAWEGELYLVAIVHDQWTT